MTDKDIIKALECCKNLQDCECCPNQPYDVKKGTMACLCQVISNSIDLINRQKAEIEKSNNTIKMLNNINNDMLDRQPKLLECAEKRVKQAIKEFAERLISVSHPYADTQMVFEIQIKNLVKEMVGDTE